MKTIRVLTLGNSFAENALRFLDDIATSDGSVRFVVGRANLGGCSLEKHWNLDEYARRVPGQKTYRFGTSDGFSREVTLREALASNPWDFVTLQQVSAKSWRRETFQPHLGLLIERIKHYAPAAEICLHQTWPYRSDAPFFPLNGLTQESMFERIRSAYARYADELGVRVIPSGEAVQRARRAPGRTFVWPDPAFDYPNAVAPALPRQDHSLAVGWKWNIRSTPEGVPEMSLDAKHLNAAGCYLVGCVWWEFLTSRDARSVTFSPAEIDADWAELLRATAHEVCCHCR